MWDIVRKSRKQSTTTNVIKIKDLEQYLTSKLSVSPESTKVMDDADSLVKDKLQATPDVIYSGSEEIYKEA